MNNVMNPMADIYHSQLEASRRFAEVVFSGTERIDHVVIEATHRAFTNQLNLAHAAVSMRDPKELAGMQSNMLAHRPDSAMSFQKEMMRLLSEIQNEMGKSVKECMDKLGSTMTQTAGTPAKAPQDKVAEVMFNPLSGIFSMWETAMREVATLTNKNVAAATSKMQQATDDAMHTTVRVNDAAAEQTAGIAQIAAEAAAEAAAAVLHEHLNATGQGTNGSRSGSASAAERSSAGSEQSERQGERRPSTSGARRK